jgi:hypothetical protein
MASHDVKKEIEEIMSITGQTIEELKEKFELRVMTNEITAYNRRDESAVKTELANLKRQAEKKFYMGSADYYKKPYFKKAGHEWVIVARGCDFADGAWGPVVGVRKRNGEVRFVEVIEAVDTKSEDVRIYHMA